MASPNGPSPFSRAIRLIASERGDMGVLLAYAVAVAILLLAVPLAVQALVNTVTTGLFVQPIVILTALVLGGLLLAGGLQLAGIGVVEVLQRRVFIRTSLLVSDNLVRARTEALRGRYAPELVNRFFDVLTVQKTLSKILVDGVAAVVQATLAMVVLGLFSPLLLLVSLIVVVLFATIVGILGIGATQTALQESTSKYELVGGLEDLARCHAGLKVHGESAFFQEKTDSAACDYLDAREAHFKKVQRQLGATFVLIAVANAATLAVGGALVLAGQLTLGSVVAAQLIVSLLMVALDKVVRHAEGFYDLLASLTKLGLLTDLPTERSGGRDLPPASERGAMLRISGVQFAYDTRSVIEGLSLELAPGERASLVGESGAGKSTVAALIAGLENASHGLIEIDGLEVRDADLDLWRRGIGLAGGEREIFEGTLAENVSCGRTTISTGEIRRALSIVGFDADLVRLENGLSTRLVSGGRNLSGGQVQRILLARAIADRPRLLLLDETFVGLDERLVGEVLDRLFDPANPWTILDISHDPEIVRRSERVFVLAEGRIVSDGTPAALSQEPDGPFSQLFPFLSNVLRGAKPTVGGRS